MATVLFHCGRFVCFPVATGKDEKRTEQFLSRHPFCSAVSCLNSSVIPPGSAVKQGDYLFNNKKVGWVIWVSASPLLIFFFQLKKKKRHSQSGWNTWVNLGGDDSLLWSCSFRSRGRLTRGGRCGCELCTGLVTLRGWKQGPPGHCCLLGHGHTGS